MIHSRQCALRVVLAVGLQRAPDYQPRPLARPRGRRQVHAQVTRATESGYVADGAAAASTRRSVAQAGRVTALQSTPVSFARCGCAIPSLPVTVAIVPVHTTAEKSESESRPTGSLTSASPEPSTGTVMLPVPLSAGSQWPYCT